MNYVRDGVLRPTMSDSGLSTILSLGQFTTGNIVRGLSCQRKARGGGYLVRVVRALGTGVRSVRGIEQGGGPSLGERPPALPQAPALFRPPSPGAPWWQYLAP